MGHLDYPFSIRPLTKDEGAGYVIEFPDLPGCMSDGETPEDTIRNGADAARCWIAAMRKAGPRRLHAIGGLLCVALLALIASGRPAVAGLDYDCSRLEIRLVGIPEAAKARCSGFGGSYETIDASDETNVFVITHRSAVNSSYVLVRTTVKGMFKDSGGFSSTEAWGEEFEVEDFNVTRFKGTLLGRQGLIACFGFVRHSGHETRPSGYRHIIGSIHCNLTGTETSDERLR